MEHLADKRLILFAGKGGVGKTTCSSAAALAMAKAGRKTLLVTVDPAKRLKDSLGVDVGSKETPIQPNLHAMMLDSEAVIREHLQRELPHAKIEEHPLFRYVTNYLPGLNELMAIGKLNDIREAGEYDLVVVDTAPTGHALSFLWAPKAIQELMSEKSILRWAMKGYAVWQQLSGAARKMGGVFKKKEDRKAPPPDIDFESLFADIESEAKKIQSYLTDPDHAALVLVTLPERLPVEETCELHATVRDELDMQVAAVVVNKVQPDPFADQHLETFEALLDDEVALGAFIQAAAKGAKVDAGLMEGLVEAARFAEVRRHMNLDYVRELAHRITDAPLTLVPLFRRDVQGLDRLDRFQRHLFDPASDWARQQ